MSIFDRVVKLFWNHDEKRLRALWRLGLHTGILFILTTAATTGLMLFAVIIDLVSGANIQDVLAGTEPMQIMEVPWVGTVIIPLATFLGVLLTTFLIGKWVDRRKFKQFGIVFTPTWWGDLAFGLLLGAFLMTVIFLIGLLTGAVQITGYFEPYLQDANFLSGFIQALILFIFVGIYEELLSRGYHLINLAEGLSGKFLGKRGGLIFAFLISSLVFGVLHLGNPNATLFSTLNISLAGIFLGLGMVMTGSLAIPIGLHITWNLFQGNVFGFPVSGIQTGATIIATETVGMEWLVGGPFGPESGVISLLAMVLGLLLTLLWLKRKGPLSMYTELAAYKPDTDVEKPRVNE